MSENASTPPTDPSWERFSEGLKASRAASTTAPTPNEVARLLQRLDEREAQAPSWTRLLAPAAVAALVVAGLVTWAVLRGDEVPETPWTAVAVVTSKATTTGTVTETAADGRALFQVGDDRIGVGPGTRVEVAAASTKATRLVLSKGSVAAHVDPARGARRFDVETPLGRVHVVGTIFRVEAGEALVVEVEKGTVEVTAGGKTTKVTVGERLEAKDGAVSVGARAGGAFAELSEVAPVAQVEPEVTPEAQPTPEVQPEPIQKKRPQPNVAAPPKLAEWRTRAARGECGLVMPEVKRFLATSPQEVSARLTLADCQKRTGDVSGAVASYLAAAEGKGPDANRGALLAASLLQDELKQPKRALPLFDRYLARGAESKDLEASTLVRKARAFQALGRSAEARQTLEVVLTKYPESPAAADALRLRDAVR
jgi:hypothetical protein